MKTGFVFTTDAPPSEITPSYKIQYNIRNALLTPLGTRPFLPRFGSLLYTLQKSPITRMLIDLSCIYIRQCIANSVEDVIVNNITSSINELERTINFSINFTYTGHGSDNLSLNFSDGTFS